MFDLTPSARRPLLNVETATDTSTVHIPSDHEKRLARDLEAVLANPFPTHRKPAKAQANVHRDIATSTDGETPLICAQAQLAAGTAVSVPAVDYDSEFQWTSDDDLGDDDILPEAQHLSAHWLKRAQWQDRVSKVRIVGRWTLVLGGFASVLFFTL